MSTEETTATATLIPAGIDLGSCNARIAIIPKSQLTQPSPTPTIVPNEIGARYTLALSMPEPETEADPLNDQYWDKPNSNKKAEQDAAGATAPTTFLYGDAARRTLHRLKKPLKPHFVFETIHSAVENTDDDVDATVENNMQSKLEPAQAFFSHLSTQATSANGATAHPSSLRYVLSIPVTISSSPSQIETYVQTVQNGMVESMRQIGYDTAPEIINASADRNLNKKEKKQIIKSIEQNPSVLAVITHPVAIGHAHGIFDEVDVTNSNNHKWKNILVVNWGASSLTLTHLTKNNNNNNLTSIQKFQHESKSCCGINILSILVSHTAEIFERNKRGMIPRGETLLNKKAKAKLEVACEDALRSFGYSPKAHVTIDGLIDGIDCQVEIMLARFEMLLAGTMRMAENMIKDFVDKSGVEFDGVLSAGGIMRMNCVDSIMKRLFQGKWRGKAVGDVAPEEAIALGCARFAHMLLESSPNHNNDNYSHTLASSNEEEKKEQDIIATNCIVEEKVLLSPVGIGLSLQEGDPAAVVMIEKQTPLPALVTKNISLTSTTSLGVMQIFSSNSNKDQEKEQPDKMIGKIEGIDASATSVEVTMELSCKGQLSVLINGGPSFVI